MVGWKRVISDCYALLRNTAAKFCIYFLGVEPIRRKPIQRKTDSAKAFLAKGVSAKILKCYLHVIYEF
jgi:hypothetical protein